MIGIAKKVFRRVRSMINCISSIPVIIDCFITKLLYEFYRRKQANNTVHKTANPYIFSKQFVAHGRYNSINPNNSLILFRELLEKGFRIIECDVMFTKDNVPVLCHDENIKEFAKDKSGNSVSKLISKLTYDELRKYNFSLDPNTFLEVTRFEEVVSLAKKYNACIEIDLAKLYLGRRRYRILYDIVNRYDMLSNVIWEVLQDFFYSILYLDSNVIIQLDHTWSEKAINKYKKYHSNTIQIILSEWFPGHVNKNYKDIIKLGHQSGFLMKCATLNSIEEAQKMFSINVDLITTDTLSNDGVIN